MTDDDHRRADRSGPPPDGGATSGLPGVHPAVYASNWRTVLVIDAAMGAAVAFAGVIVAVVWNLFAGAALGALGAAYVTAVVRRGRQWADLRRDAGL